MVGAIVIKQKYFNLFQQGIKPGLLDLQANALPPRCKSWFCIIYLDPVTNILYQTFTPAESLFLIRILSVLEDKSTT